MSEPINYTDYSDAEIYGALIEREPRMATTCSLIAEMLVLHGRDDEWILERLRATWPADTKPLWDEDDEYRGKLILRAGHHMAKVLRKSQP